MNRSLNTAASGMQAQQLLVDTIANNLANASTHGFKGSDLDFRALFYQTLREPGTGSGNGQMDTTGLQIGSGVDVAGSRISLEQGAIELTGRSGDIAIEGDGFFQVRLPNGQSLFTRKGAFRVDGNGQLVTPEGYVVEPAITFPQGVTDFAVAPTGEVSYLDENGQMQDLAVLQIVTFPNAYGLRAEGQSLYAETGASGAPVLGNPGTARAGLLVDRALEGSNVSTIEQLVAMIKAQRSYEMNSRAVSVSDEMMQTAAQVVR
ncbi:MAG: flagellar basal-body rod protein FlgG [Planctomycetota bacterium]|jgi:flagellar basal-body rod protein FlgG|nr:flagellar basal-body rod protein FlgG [Planctomycetota bacterium]